ncbi:hypothetical protein CHLRE_12g483476v5 [Chlamydomonas reinhardtii]|uniref:Uncharacterized protein n=1 Tax=Chlamydomonas reinhardtii TaxID=3055 RepID=A0A2K3D1L3_CHLRE|nr:uncharacterized protein CHLRE_12g483476v5 [Chlamydomonas reinhardtii]PNW74423.1 hypothetical protein CHLRE_12g483476v5 [Chlamydomonas reinhardtii]
MEQRRQRVMTTEQRQPLRHRQPHHKFSWAARPVGSGACSFQSRAEAWVRLQTPAPGAATIQPEPSTGRG